MTDKERLASELKEIYWDSDCSNTGFTDMATYVQKAVLEGKIEAHSEYVGTYQAIFHAEKKSRERVNELTKELNELNGKG